ncbi:MAG: cation:dicarboxylase symporter family transporter [Acidobacteria bacterium]|nr:cation:dicarboxylase symporter family transporter [Acidobacteriota bacterium]
MGSTVRRPSLTAWIFIAMAGGIVAGILWPATARRLWPISNVFLRLIQSIIAPLLFGTVVHGMAGNGERRRMGWIGLKAIVYFLVVTAIALFLGLAAANLARPGEGIRIRQNAAERAPAQPVSTVGSALENIFPVSVIDAMARGDVLQIMVFSLLFGAACAAIGPKARPVVSFAESLAEVMFRYTKYVMVLAPLGVFAALAATIGSQGLAVLSGLGKLIATLYLALLVFVVLVLGAVMALARIPLKKFYESVRQPFLIAFSTASSNAALPRALENMGRFGVPKHIVALVLPAGYSFNLEGSTLYLPLAAVFVAQSAGIELTLTEQMLLFSTLMLTSKGVAGVPRASLVVLTGAAASFRLPFEGVAMLLGVDAVMDMGRTSVNVLGNCLAAAVVARWEGVKFAGSGDRAAPLEKA